MKFKELKEVKFKLPKDLFILIPFITLAVIFSERPATKLDPKVEGPPKESRVKPEDKALSSNTKENPRPIQKASKDFPFVEKRNPFTPDGAYQDFLLPENPYILIAVKKGDPDQALLRIYNGEVLVVKVGQTLIDGYRVIKITDRSVWLERAGKRRELKIFQVEVNKWLVSPR